MPLNVIVTRQVERLAHALNVSICEERANVRLKAGRLRHRASQLLDYTDIEVSFVNPKFLFGALHPGFPTVGVGRYIPPIDSLS